MVTEPDTHLEGCLSLSSLCIYLHAELRQRLDRLHVPVECRHVQRCHSIHSLRVFVHAKQNQRLDRLHVPVDCRGV
jgi:hypothetical protein